MSDARLVIQEALNEVPETPKRQRKGKVQETASENTPVSKHFRQFKKAYLNMVKAWVNGNNAEWEYNRRLVSAEFAMLNNDEKEIAQKYTEI